MKTVAFLMVLTISSCVNGNKLEKRLPKNRTLPDSLISFFPSSNNENMKFLHGGGNVFTKTNEKKYEPFEMNVYMLIEAYKIKSREAYVKIDNSLKKESIENFNCKNDTDFFIINSPSVLYERYDSIFLKKKYKSIEKGYFVLDFVDYFMTGDKDLLDTSSVLGLGVDYTMYIIKSGNQYIIDVSKYIEWDILPENFKHGYTSGVVANSKELTLFYWVVAW
jgi:hypothetical protein